MPRAHFRTSFPFEAQNGERSSCTSFERGLAYWELPEIDLRNGGRALGWTLLAAATRLKFARRLDGSTAGLHW